MLKRATLFIGCVMLGWVVLIPPTFAQSSSPPPRPEPGTSGRGAVPDRNIPAPNKVDGQGRNVSSFRDRTQNDVERLRDQGSRRRDGNTDRASTRDDDGDRTSGDVEVRSNADYRNRVRDGESDADGRPNDDDEDQDRERRRERAEDDQEDRYQERTRTRDRETADDNDYRAETRDRYEDQDRSEIRDRVRDEFRDTIRGARDTARDTARDATRSVRETIRDSASRDSRRSSRQEFDVNTVRSADVGLWFNRASRNGLVINDVASSGPIARLGFREGDRIVSVNGYRVRDERQFVRDLFDDDYRDERVPVIVDRSGTQRTIYVEPSTLVEHYASSSSNQDPLEQFGIVLDDRYNNRLVVWKVIPRTPAYYAGVRASDVITAWNNQRFTTKDQLVQALGSVSEGDEVWLTVTRGQQQRRLEAEITSVAVRPETRTTYRPFVEDAEPAAIETYPTTERPRPPVLPNRPAAIPRPGILPRNR